jgi:Ser/Thr protein kinase RdoA (MazF antagonist)
MSAARPERRLPATAGLCVVTTGLSRREPGAVHDHPAEAVARRFCGAASVEHIEPHPGGHIHDTWFVAPGPGAPADGLVLQRLNDRVFPNCALMMDNVLRVTTHLHRRRQPTVRVVRSGDGEALVHDGDGRAWRAFERIPAAVSHLVVDRPSTALQIGRALGRFVAQVQDLPGPPLVEPIPGFKDFGRRREDFEFSVEHDPFDRAWSCRWEIEDVRAYHHLGHRLEAALESGELPTRIVHNDAKAANVLLDEATGEAVCVVDLDTVAPGTVLFDVGDLLRSATITSAEDEAGLAGLAVRDNLLAAALGGYLSEVDPLLCDEERALIPLAGPLMAYESAMRFLTDHLAGDTYFRADRPRQNLDRARAQLQVLKALDRAAERVAQLAGAA